MQLSKTSLAKQTVKLVRSALPQWSRDSSTTKGLTYFVVASLFYIATFTPIALLPTWWGKLLLSLVNGLAIGVLFIIGHDACHGSLTPNQKLNKVLGRLAFMPSLHPYTAWEYSHNALHHGWTNLRGKDPVYAPLTKQEFDALSVHRRLLERMYRTVLGIGLMYFIEIWWRLEILPNGHHQANINKRGNHNIDRLLIIVYPFIQLAVLLFVAILGQDRQGNVGVDVGQLVFFGVVIPFATWNWLMGFATFQHHTHPRVIWYNNQKEWNFYRSQVQGTVHIVFPKYIERILCNIMEHTAHHVDTRVPLYNLTDAQKDLEAEYGDDIITEPFTMASFFGALSTCQLYDYKEHQWLNFDGLPTTPPRILSDEIRASTS